MTVFGSPSQAQSRERYVISISGACLCAKLRAARLQISQYLPPSL
jgi:hypothetical protein